MTLPASPGLNRHAPTWGLVPSERSSGERQQCGHAAIAARCGSRVAVVALARKLAGILYAMWRDGASFEARAPRAGDVAAVAAER